MPANERVDPWNASEGLRDRHRRLEELFHMGAELAAADHVAFADRHCGDDHALADHLLRLLRQDAAGTKPYLISPVVRDTSRATVDVGEERIPEFIDRYHLVEQIGEGGMGLVFRAQQLQPVEREVAIKIPKRRADVRLVASQFARERQLLAGFDHPCIVRVFDGGTTDRGDPYVVMEHVPGVPFTRYCRESRPAVSACVSLIVDVCDALEHVHARGVVHADLKPTNIIVGEDDRGAPFAKVIDFGVARPRSEPDATADDALDRGMTPTYASPERLRGERADVRDDVYSVGVLLREALFESRSEATSESGTRRDRLAENELMAITRRASAIERADRYASMADFADDLRRWSAHRSGRGGGVWSGSRFAGRQRSLFLGLALVAAAVATGLFLLATRSPPSTATPAAQTSAARASAERDPLRTLDASSSSHLHEMAVLVSEAIALVRPGGPQDTRVRLSEILDRVVPHFEGSTCSEGMLRRRAAESFLRLGDYTRATENLRRAFELNETETVFSQSEWFSLAFHLWQTAEEGDVSDRRRLGWRLVNRAGRPLEALPATRRHLARLVRDTYHGRFHQLASARADAMQAAATELESTSDDWLVIGSVCEFIASQVVPRAPEDDFRELIEQLHRDAASAFLRCVPPSDPRSISAQLNLAEARLSRDALDDAERIAQRLLDDAGVQLPADHWRAARARSIVGACRSRRGDFPGATPLLERAYRDIEEALGPSARGTQAALRRLIAHRVRAGVGAPEETRVALARAIAFSRRSPATMAEVIPAFGGRFDELVRRMQGIVATLSPTEVGARCDAAAHEEAVARIEAAGEWRRRHVRADSPRAVIFARHLADLAVTCSAPGVRTVAASEALRVLRAHAERLPVILADVAAIVAERHVGSDAAEALALVQEARRALDRAGVSTFGGVGAYGKLARVSVALGRADDAIHSLAGQWKRLVDEFGIRHHLTVECLDQSAGIAALTGDATGFETLLRRHLDDSFQQDDNASRLKSLAQIAFSVPGLDPTTYRRAMTFAKAIESDSRDLGCVQGALGMGAFRLGDHEGALAHLKEAIRLHKARNPVDWAYCALVLQATDRAEQAQQALARMRRHLGHRGPHNDRARRAMREFAAATPGSSRAVR